MHDRR